MKKLFDKLFRGPKLSRANAETFSKIIALKLVILNSIIVFY